MTFGSTYMPAELSNLLTRVCIHLGVIRDEFVVDAIARAIEAQLSIAVIDQHVNHNGDQAYV